MNRRGLFSPSQRRSTWQVCISFRFPIFHHVTLSHTGRRDHRRCAREGGSEYTELCGGMSATAFVYCFTTA